MATPELDKVAEKGRSPDPVVDEQVTLPAATWERVRRLAELGERVEKGELVESSELEAALAKVEALGQQLELLLRKAVGPAAPATDGEARMRAQATALRAWRPASRRAGS